MTPKFEIFCQNFTLWDGNFGQFAGKKSYFLAFFKIILELFRKCLGIVFVLKRPSFWCIYTSKCWLIAVIRVHFDNKCCKSKSKKCPTRYFRNFVCFFWYCVLCSWFFFKCVFDRERKVRQKLQKVCRNRKLEPKKKKTGRDPLLWGPADTLPYNAKNSQNFDYLGTNDYFAYDVCHNEGVNIFCSDSLAVINKTIWR